MENFGEYLKAEREKKNIRLEEIASITKIHLHSLELLEANRIDELPPEPFLRGFIIAYAKYVGLDPRATITRFMDQTGKGAAASAEDTADEPSIGPRENPSEVIENAWQLPINKILVGAGITLVLAIVGTLVYVGKNSATNPVVAEAPTPESPSLGQTIAETLASPGANPTTDGKPLEDNRNVASPVTEKKAEVAAESSPVSMKASPLAERGTQVETAAPLMAKKTVENPTPVKAEEAAKEKAAAVAKAKTPEPVKPPTNEATGEEFKHEVTVEGQDRTWIKVVIDEKPPVEFFLPKGEKASYKAKNKIKVVLGNSTGTKVTHNGEADKGKKFQGTIRSYIYPPNARFPQDTPTKRITSSGAGSEESDPLLESTPE